MRTKRFQAGLLAAVLCLSLAGCAQNAIPEMTADEMQIIGEYAAITMMKYDASSRSRLVTLPDGFELFEPEPETPSEPEPTKEPSGMGETDNTPVVDMTQQETGPASMEEMLNTEAGVSITYLGAGLYDVYPDNGEIGGFALPATQGKKLLVLSFQIMNGSQQEQRVDIASQNVTFRIKVNSEYTRTAMTAMLPDDMTMFQETIPAGESAEAVLIIEVEQASIDEIQTIGLSLKNAENVYTIQLK